MSVYTSAMLKDVPLYLADEAATIKFGVLLAHVISGAGGVITLKGDLGAGKTCLVRSLIQAMGHAGRVVSPTYTLMEPYAIGGRQVFHLDLYRLSDAEELAYLGVRDINPQHDLILVEWPENGAHMLPLADLALAIRDASSGGREISAQMGTQCGTNWWLEAVAAFKAGL
jgi:tRNA threonylcarbamoyladenosine biosynthesis protein TsaE